MSQIISRWIFNLSERNLLVQTFENSVGVPIQHSKLDICIIVFFIVDSEVSLLFMMGHEYHVKLKRLVQIFKFCYFIHLMYLLNFKISINYTVLNYNFHPVDLYFLKFISYPFLKCLATIKF